MVLTKRSQLLNLLRIALYSNENRFARDVALAWLAIYPGDLEINLFHSKALVQENNSSQALPLLDELCEIDPQYLETWELLYLIHSNSQFKPSGDIQGAIVALTNKPSPQATAPEWGFLLWIARNALERKELEEAEESIQKALTAAPETPLAAVFHLEVLRAFLTRNSNDQNSKFSDETISSSNLDPMGLQKLAELYHQRWPKCQYFSLVLADTLMDGGQQEVAVDLLHQAVAIDVVGQVSTRIWGENHRYRDLWPNNLSFSLEIAIPTGVAAALGWNKLPAQVGTNFKKEGEKPLKNPTKRNNNLTNLIPKTHSKFTQKKKLLKISELQNTTLRKVKSEFVSLGKSINHPNIARSDGRFPIYIVFTNFSGLEKKYGTHGTAEIDQALKNLVKIVSSYQGWGAKLIYGDEIGSIKRLGVKSAKSDDPMELRRVILDLDESLRKFGEMIGALLIVGGPEIVPFHFLPNPIDDLDINVPSDNPYASREENYFIPEWPVGRIPGGVGDSPEPLINMTTSICDHHTRKIRVKNSYQAWWQRLIWTIGLKQAKLRPSFGFTTAIWKRASKSVFRPIGQPRELTISPPHQVNNQNGINGVHSNSNASWGKLGYFNLHGLMDSANWFGQKNPFGDAEGPEYPVALRPSDVINGGKAPEIVFTEACFGAYIQGKKIEDALSLKFLSCGSLAVIGSTVISYGTVRTPLVAADLLGHSFWMNLRSGKPVGEALRQAKIHLAREMHRRQGFLDGEDQKTLISFILYGDPLIQPMGISHTSQPKITLRPLLPPRTTSTVCDRTQGNHRQPQSVSGEVLSTVNRVVAKYLPGMNDAQIWLSEEQSARCEHDCELYPLSQLGAKSQATNTLRRKVVTLSKQLTKTSRVHQHYARLTLDNQGKVIKMVISK